MELVSDKYRSSLSLLLGTYLARLLLKSFSVFFTEKRLFQENVWQGFSGGAGAGAGEKPCQTGPYY